MDTNILNEEKNIRGGTGSKGDPVEIKRAIAEATKDLKRAGNDLEKITSDKEELLHDLAELRVHESEDVPSVIKKAIEKSIRAVQKKLKEVNGLLPEVDLSADQKKIHKIITEWKENKKILNNARRALARGEHKLAIDPADRKAMGDTNRAEATIYDANQKLDKLAQEATLIEESTIKDPLAGESINIHTGNETTREQEQKPIEVAQPQEASLPPTPMQNPEPTTSPEPQENESILYTHEQALTDQQAWENKHRSSVEKIITSALSEITHDDISQTAESLQENSTPQPPEATIAEAPTTELPASEPPLLLDDGNDNAPEKKDEIVIPVIVERNENVVEEESPQIETPAPVEISTPQEITPPLPRAEPLPPSIEKIFNDHLDKLFGDKGFLGFGGTKGVDSRHWTDPVNGFSIKTIDEIRNPRETSESMQGELWGVANEQERTKMQDYILQATNQTGISPNPEEKVVDYIKRVLEITAQNNNG